MRKGTPKLAVVASALTTALMMVVSGCGSRNAPPSVTVSGAVVQGNVEGAIVFADRNGNSLYDTGEVSTASNPEPSLRVTASNGSFTLVIPPDYGPYRFVTYGGTDTTTNLPAAQLIAEAGSTRVTPITTLVATAPPESRAALISNLQSLGISRIDADINVATPAIIALAKSVELALTGLDQATTTGSNGISLSSRLQEVTARTIAAAVAASTVDQLENSTTLAEMISSSAGTALSAVAADPAFSSQLDVSNVNSIIDSVSASVGTVVQAIADASEGGLTSTSPVVEATIVAPLTDTINSAIADIVTTTQDNTTVPPPPDIINPPTTGSSGGNTGGTGTGF